MKTYLHFYEAISNFGDDICGMQVAFLKDKKFEDENTRFIAEVEAHPEWLDRALCSRSPEQSCEWRLLVDDVPANVISRTRSCDLGYSLNTPITNMDNA